MLEGVHLTLLVGPVVAVPYRTTEVQREIVDGKPVSSRRFRSSRFLPKLLPVN